MAFNKYELGVLEKLHNSEIYKRVEETGGKDAAEFLSCLFLERSYDFTLSEDRVLLTIDPYIEREDVTHLLSKLLDNVEYTINTLDNFETSDENIEKIVNFTISDYLLEQDWYHDYYFQCLDNFKEMFDSALERLEKENPNNEFLARYRDYSEDPQTLVKELESAIPYFKYESDIIPVYDLFKHQDVKLSVLDVGRLEKRNYKGLNGEDRISVFNTEANQELSCTRDVFKFYELESLLTFSTTTEKREEIIKNFKEAVEENNITDCGILRFMHQNGFVLEDLNLQNHHSFKENKNLTLLKNFVDEVFNGSSGLEAQTYLMEMPFEDVLKMKIISAIETKLLKEDKLEREKQKTIVIKNAMCGLMDPINGGGSILELGEKTKYQVEIPVNNLDFVIQGVESGYYEADKIYGLSGSCYKQGEYKISNMQSQSVVNNYLKDFVNNIEFKKENKMIEELNSEVKDKIEVNNKSTKVNGLKP